MRFETLAFRLDDGIAHVGLTRGAQGNPLDEAMAGELRRLADLCTARAGEIRALLVSAEGKYFSVGGDLKMLAADRTGLPDRTTRMLADINAALLALAQLDAPSVALVHGVAAGGAMGLVAACDFVVATPEARFVAAFPTIGLSPDSGSTWHLPRKVGPQRARAFFLLEQSWSAIEAESFGLVDRIVPAEALAAEGAALAHRLADGPTRAFGVTRRLLGSGAGTTLAEHLAAEAAGIARCIETDDCWNAIHAKLDKRTARFEGR